MRGRKFHFVIGLVIVVIVVAGGVVYCWGAESRKGNAAEGFAMAAGVATMCYESLAERAASGDPRDLDEAYIWSRRAMDADIRANPKSQSAKLAAARAHRKRIEDLSDAWTKELKRKDPLYLPAPHQAAAISFYLFEAQSVEMELNQRNNLGTPKQAGSPAPVP